MKIQDLEIGDRVEVISAGDTGKVINIYARDNGQICVAVDMDNPEWHMPKPKDMPFNSESQCTYHTTPDDVRKITLKSSSEFKDLWDSNE